MGSKYDDPVLAYFFIKQCGKYFDNSYYEVDKPITFRRNHLKLADKNLRSAEPYLINSQNDINEKFYLRTTKIVEKLHDLIQEYYYYLHHGLNKSATNYQDFARRLKITMSDFGVGFLPELERQKRIHKGILEIENNNIRYHLMGFQDQESFFEWLEPTTKTFEEKIDFRDKEILKTLLKKAPLPVKKVYEMPFDKEALEEKLYILNQADYIIKEGEVIKVTSLGKEYFKYLIKDDLLKSKTNTPLRVIQLWQLIVAIIAVIIGMITLYLRLR